MHISVERLGKKYGSNWVFKNLNETIEPGVKVAITGNNGSGKSTLLQLLAGLIIPSSGEIKYGLKPQISLSNEEAIFKMAMAAPYIELVEEFTLMELLTFHFKFKKLVSTQDLKTLIDIMYLKGNENKRIKNFSSGMKQRLKLALAFYTEAKVVFLDEPTTNLDERGVNWYLNQIESQFEQKTFVISSNQKVEYSFCDKIINMNNEFYK